MKRSHPVLRLTAWIALAGTVSLQGAAAEDSFNWQAVDTWEEQVAYIRNTLEAWEGEKPEVPPKKLRVVYFHPKNRKPQTGYQDRWDKILTDFETFFRTQMQACGFGDVTIALDRKDGQVQLIDVEGEFEDDGTYTYRSGRQIQTEVFRHLAGMDIRAEEETLLIVCGLSRTEDQQVTIYSPYYGMGADQTRGICFVMDSDWLSMEGLMPDPEGTILQVKEHRDFEPFTLARFNTTYIGGAIHELGHGLSLPHTFATPAEAPRGTALMGSGNYTYRQEWRNESKGSFLTHAHATRLRVHPLFSGILKEHRTDPNPRLQNLSVTETEKGFQVSGRVTADVLPIAVIGYNDGENPGQPGYFVNYDYDATAWISVVNPDGDFQVAVDQRREGNHQLRLCAVFANGATKDFRFQYTVNQGTPDFTVMRQEFKGP